MTGSKHHINLLVVQLKWMLLQKDRAVLGVLHPVVLCTQLKQKLVVVQPPQPYLPPRFRITLEDVEDVRIVRIARIPIPDTYFILTY
jgi:hypothetical protein